MFLCRVVVEGRWKLCVSELRVVALFSRQLNNTDGPCAFSVKIMSCHVKCAESSAYDSHG